MAKGAAGRVSADGVNSTWHSERLRAHRIQNEKRTDRWETAGRDVEGGNGTGRNGRKEND